jgi:hypothetical protein
MSEETFGQLDLTVRTVRLEGFTPIMFDRYAGSNDLELAVADKVYQMPNGAGLCIPAANISSFLSAKNTDSVAKLIGGRSYKLLASALLGFIVLSPVHIPITRDGEGILFNGFTDDVNEEADMWVDRRVAKLKGGIPNPKVRPVLNIPWSIEFTLTIIKNDIFDDGMVREGFRRGGLMYGLGTFRGVYGKFLVERWE